MSIEDEWQLGSVTDCSSRRKRSSECEEEEDLTYLDFSFTLPICFWDEYSCVDDGIPSSNLSVNHLQGKGLSVTSIFILMILQKINTKPEVPIL